MVGEDQNANRPDGPIDVLTGSCKSENRR
jgi:hypothetical protein